MVGELIRVEEKTVTTRFEVTPDNIFCQNGYFTEAGLIENMAQTAAAAIGSDPGLADHPPPLGFIGGIRRLKIHGYPASGDILETTITVVYELAGASMVNGSVVAKNRLLAECELKIFLLK